MNTIFVSSTFRDMQLERDALQTRVLPLINETAEKYGQTVSFCDLRWGIDTSDLESEEGSRKVLDVCLDEIDRCQRPMIVILGERYGWIPSEDLIRDAAERKQLQLESLEMSVTALEIEYGALGSDANLENTLFYFREIEGDVPEDYRAEDAEHEAKLNALKDRINRLTGGRVQHYTLSADRSALQGIDAFCTMVTEDIRKMLLPQWEKYEALSDEERERLRHDSFVREKNELFRARKTLRDALVEKVLHEQPLLVLKGAAGSGKSALLSAMAMRMKELGQDAVPYISCLTLKSSTALSLVKSMCLELEKRLSFTHPETEFQDEKEWLQYFESLCREMNSADTEPVIFLIDAVDQLFPDGLSDELAFVPKTLGKNVRMVVTCLSDFSAGVYAFETILPMDRAEQEDIIAGMLESRRREIGRDVIRKMLEKTSADNPLYLTQLLSRLLLMDREDFRSIIESGDGMDAITAYQCRIIEEAPEGLGSLAAAVFSVAAERINKELIEKISQLLAVSRSGLRMADLQAALPDTFNTLDFIHFVHYMSDSFIQREDGRFDFMHKSMREGILEQCGDQKRLHAGLAAAFEKEPEEDPVRRTEMIYHVLMARDTEKFLQYLEGILDPEEEDAGQTSGEKKTLLKSAGRRVYEVCREDRGEYYLSILDEAEKRLQDAGVLVRFTALYLFTEFPSGARANRILGRILEKNLNLLVRVKDVSGRVLAQAYRFLGRTITYTDSSQEAKETARPFYEKGRQALESVPREENTPDDFRLLGHLWYDEGQTYEQNDNFFRNEDAVRCFKKAEEAYREAAKDETQRDERDANRANCLVRMGEACSNVTGVLLSVQKEALDYYEQARQIQKELLERRKTAGVRRQLILSGKSLADCRLLIGGLENNRKALLLLEENVDLSRQIYEEQKDLRNLRRLRDALDDLSDVLARSYELPHRIHALKILQEQYLLSLRIARESDNYYSAATALRRAGGILSGIGDAGAKLTALGFLDAADELLRTHEGLPDNADPAAHTYWKIRGDIYAGLGSREKAEKCYAIRNRCIDGFIKKKSSYAYAELLEILDLMDTEYLYKVPTNLHQIFRSFASTDYVPHLDPAVPLDEQEISESTRALIAMLLVGCWAEDEEEQRDLLRTYKANEEEYRRMNPAAQNSQEKERSRVRDASYFFTEEEQPDLADRPHLPVRPSYPGFWQDPFLRAPSRDDLLKGRACIQQEGEAYRPGYAGLFFSRAAAMGSAAACEEMVQLIWKTEKKPDPAQLYTWRNIKDLLQKKETKESSPAGSEKAGIGIGRSQTFLPPAAEDIFSMLFAAPFARNYGQISEEAGRALRGDADAMCALAERFRAGEAPFSKADPEMAVQYWKLAMEKGSEDAEYAYADYCVFGKEFRLKKTDNGFSMLKELAAQGNVKAQIRVGEYLYRNDSVRDIPQAIAMLEKVAEDGHVEALYHLGNLYSREKSGEVRDLEKSLRYLTTAAEEGSAEAFRLLGDLYSDQSVDFYDPVKALEYYEKGADLGSREAAIGAFRLHFDKKGELPHDLGAAMMQERAYAMKPTETALKNLVIYYEGYRSLPRNEGMYLYYRLIREASEGSLWAGKEGVLEKLKAIHQADSRDIRYFLRETPQERTDYDALKTQDFTIGDFLFRIPDSYHPFLNPVSRGREIREDSMIFLSSPRADGHCARLIISQKESETDQLSELAEVSGTLQEQAQVYLAQDIPAIYTASVSEAKDGETEYTRRLDALIPGTGKDRPFRLQMLMTYKEPAAGSAAAERPWSCADDFICMVDAVKKRQTV